MYRQDTRASKYSHLENPNAPDEPLFEMHNLNDTQSTRQEGICPDTPVPHIEVLPPDVAKAMSGLEWDDGQSSVSSDTSRHTDIELLPKDTLHFVASMPLAHFTAIKCQLSGEDKKMLDHVRKYYQKREKSPSIQPLEKEGPTEGEKLSISSLLS